ncbi:hypothetical protein PoB_000867700 [Plakobranchus ocellatus]|uniref:PH domain-containing protein n=1 Tax=Plakobranchus ocellatus TaxID=259542 RepID=A0AAV3YH41_9GAST|nr:hypothetical protein PoB_000867700 [Plakobranchus ocellatus]
MARTSLHFEANYTQIETSINQDFPESTSNFGDILQITKCAMQQPPSLGTRKKSRGSRSRTNSLEIIPESNAMNMNNNVNEKNDDMDKKCRAEDSLSYENRSKSIATNLIMNTEFDQLLPTSPGEKCDNAFEKVKLPLKDMFRSCSDTATPATKFSFQMSFKASCTSVRSHLELKSGPLVWISYRPCTEMSRYGRRDGTSNEIWNNMNINTCNTHRTPVMLKVHGSSSGSFALLTPSRSCQSQVRPLYLRLKHSEVMIDDSTSAAASDSVINGPCCFFLTLDGWDGRSFKFEANSRDAAMSWVKVLTRDNMLSSAATERTDSELHLRFEKNESVGSNHSLNCNAFYHNKLNNKSGMDGCSIDNIDNSNHTCKCLTENLYKNKNQNDLENNVHSQNYQARASFFNLPNHPSPVTSFKRDRVMPTLSESSDEDIEYY